MRARDPKPASAALHRAAWATATCTARATPTHEGQSVLIPGSMGHPPYLIQAEAGIAAPVRGCGPCSRSRRDRTGRCLALAARAPRAVVAACAFCRRFRVVSGLPASPYPSTHRPPTNTPERNDHGYDPVLERSCARDQPHEPHERCGLAARPRARLARPCPRRPGVLRLSAVRLRGGRRCHRRHRPRRNDQGGVALPVPHRALGRAGR